MLQNLVVFRVLAPKIFGVVAKKTYATKTRRHKIPQKNKTKI